jgi:hypothetical protein
MPLKFKLNSKEEIPMEAQSLYVERDGAWLLDVDGVVCWGIRHGRENFPRREASLPRQPKRKPPPTWWTRRRW